MFRQPVLAFTFGSALWTPNKEKLIEKANQQLSKIIEAMDNVYNPSEHLEQTYQKLLARHI